MPGVALYLWFRPRSSEVEVACQVCFTDEDLRFMRDEAWEWSVREKTYQAERGIEMCWES
jgi:hypothetical protein